MSTKKNIFKSLHLDRDNLYDWITEFASENFAESSVSEISLISGNQHRCKINANEKEILIDFYYNIDNTTTIQPKVGQEKDISVKIANHILSKLSFKETDVKSRSYSVHPISPDEVKVIDEYLQELSGVELLSRNRNESNKYTLYQYKSKIGDKITLKHYDNQRLQIQGKPMYLYQEVTCLLSSYFPFDEVIKQQAEFFSIDLDPKEVRDEMQLLLPNAYDVIGDKMRKVLSASLALRKIDIQLEDYSSFVYPALKTLEGYIKILFLNHDIIINKDGFGEYFSYWGKQPLYVLRPDPREKIHCEITVNALEECYSYYYKHRHSLFHAESITESTRIIEKKENADAFIAEILNLMETTCSQIKTAVVR